MPPQRPGQMMLAVAAREITFQRKVSHEAGLMGTMNNTSHETTDYRIGQRSGLPKYQDDVSKYR